MGGGGCFPAEPGLCLARAGGPATWDPVTLKGKTLDPASIVRGTTTSESYLC